MKFRYQHNPGGPHSLPGTPVGSAAQQAPALSGLVALEPIDVHDLPGDRQLLVARASGARGEIPRALASLLPVLGAFRTLEEHAAHIRSLSGTAERKVVTQILADLQRAGLLVDASAWLRRIQPSANRLDERDRWMLVITTCDRPDGFAELLQSLREYLGAAVEPAAILVVDDSRDTDALARNRALIDESLGEGPWRVEHWDRRRRERLAGDLASAYPASRGAIRWMLAPSAFAADVKTYGQVRNLTSLLTVGYRYITVDDDCTLRPRRHRDSSPGLRVRQGYRPERPFADPDALFSGTEPAELNPLAEHIALLGLSLRGVAEHLGEPWESPEWLRQSDPNVLAALSSRSRVGATSNGMLGDPGTGDMFGFYVTADEFVAERSDYMQQAVSEGRLMRIFWRASPETRFTPGGRLMSPVLGLDNRLMIPCVPPTGRGSNDDVLGSVLQSFYPELGRLDFPWALPHRPDAPSPWVRPTAHTHPRDPSPETLLHRLIQQLTPTLVGATPEVRANLLADLLQQRARDSDRVLSREADRCIVSGATARLAASQANLRNPDLRGPMREDLQLLARNAETEAYASFLPSQQWLQVFRAACAAYAEGLTLWPELRRHMAEKRGDPQ